MSVSANPYLLVLPQLMSAKNKIGRVSAFYDPTKISLAGFDSVCLDATQFREQLRQNLNVILTDEELGALVYLFDKNGDGFIDTVEFKNEFFRLGKQDRDKFNHHKAQEKEKHKKRKAKLEAKQKAYLERFSKSNVSDTWTEAQQANAIKKIAHVAFSYDSFKGGLEGFANAKHLSPTEFKEIMRRKFEMYLTPEETGALADMFDRNDIGMIDTSEFVYQFFKIGRREREYHFNIQKQKTLENQVAEKERIEAATARYGSLVQARMEPSTEEDRTSALAKITQAALHFKSDSAFSGNLWNSFESSDLNPTEFKELLKANFDIYLTPGELDAMVKLFDTDNSGDVSCVEFMTTFFRIGLRERSRLVAEKKIEQEKLARAEQIRKEKRIERQKMQTLTSIIWPRIPNENDDEAIEAPTAPISVTDLAHLVNAGPGEIVTYLMNKHAIMVSYDEMVDTSVAKDVIIGHGKQIVEEAGKTPVRSVAPMIPTGKTGRNNAFLNKRPSLQSAIGRKSDKSKKNTHKSIADMYPKASNDTKDFIRKLEEQERSVHSKTKSAEGKNGGKGGNKNAGKGPGPESGNLNEWSFADSGAAKFNMYAGDDWGDTSRPGTSANSQREGRSPNARGEMSMSRSGKLLPLEGTSIAEELCQGGSNQGVNVQYQVQMKT